MPAAVAHRHLVLAVAIALYAAIFVAFVLVGSPGIGVGHFFYVPVALVALVTRPVVGIAAGAAAAALYALGILMNPHMPPADVLTLATAIRLVNYSTTGALIGWFASDNRRLVEQLRILAERDSATGLPNTRAFEAAIERRLDAHEPFALLIGHLGLIGGRDDAGANDAFLRLADVIRGTLEPGDDLARVGDHEFAILTAGASGAEAARLAGRLEAMLSAHGLETTFGWAVHPQEGLNALSLYRAADERLYARKLIGDVKPRTLRSVS